MKETKYDKTVQVDAITRETKYDKVVKAEAVTIIRKNNIEKLTAQLDEAKSIYEVIDPNAIGGPMEQTVVRERIKLLESLIEDEQRVIDDIAKDVAPDDEVRAAIADWLQ